MKLKDYVNFNPVRSLSAFGAFVQAVILLFAKVQTWTPDLLLLVEGIQTTGLVLLGSFFVEGKTASVAGMEALQAIKDAGLPLPPKE